MRITAFNAAGPGFAQLAGQASAAETRTNRLNASVLALQGSALLAGAAIGAMFIKDGIDGAAKLQMAMQNVGNATHTTGQHLENLRRIVMSVSGQTAQSAVTIAQEMAMMSRSGLNQPSQIAALFPTMAKFADVQFLSRGADPVESIKLATQFAHYFKAYDAGSMGKMTDALNRIMFTQPEDLQRIVYQGKYFIPMATNLGMTIDQIAPYLALMGQTGFLTGRGGVGMERTLLGAINATAITQTLQNAKTRGLHDLGMIGPDDRPTYMDNGQLQFTALMTGLLAARSTLGAANFARDVYAVFGAQGQQLLSTIVDPTVQQQKARIVTSMAGMDTVQQMQAKYMQQFTGAWNMFATNFANIWANIFYPILPQLTAGLTMMAHSFAGISQFFLSHPATAQMAAWGLIIGTVGTAIAGVWKLFQAAGMLFAARTGTSLAALIFPAGLGEGIAAVFGGIASAIGAIASSPITAFLAGLKAFQELPDLGVFVFNWWQRSGPKILFSIGYAFAAITDAVVTGAKMLWTMGVNIFKFMFSNPTMLAALGQSLIGNQAGASALYQQAFTEAVGRAGGLANPGKNLGGVWGGWQSYWARKDPGSRAGGNGTVNVNVQNVNLGTSSDPVVHAQRFWAELSRKIPFALRASGGSIGHPRMSSHAHGASVYGN